MGKLYVACCLYFTLLSLDSMAQLPLKRSEPDLKKPMLFTHYAEKFSFQPETFTQLLDRSVGEVVRFDVSGQSDLVVEGKVVSVASKYNGQIESVLLRSDNVNAASLYFSKTKMEDGSISYRGMIMNKQYGDLYILEKENGVWVWKKKRYNDVISE